MRIVQLVDHHSENMGYSDACLSSSLSKLSNEIFVVSSFGNAYFNHKDYEKIFSKFHKKKEKKSYSHVNNYNLYRLRSLKTPFGIYLFGLYKLLREIKPDIVQVGEVTSFLSFQATVYNFFIKYILTLECHIHSSVYAPSKTYKQLYGLLTVKNFTKFFLKKIKQILFKYIVMKIINLKMKACFSISEDSFQIANKYLGVDKKKNKVLTLGTDTDLFYPSLDKNDNLRNKLGFKSNDIICIYTGRFDNQKKPHLLANAIKILNEKGLKQVKGLFIGAGSSEYTELLKNSSTLVLPFVDYNKLPQYYRISNIAVWPKQESTSQLDALASGLPLILNDNIGVPERVLECGFLYKDGSEFDLAYKIELLLDHNTRLNFSKNANIKAQNLYSWKKIAIEYLENYKNIINEQKNK